MSKNNVALYKHTEIGTIPEDWEVREIGQEIDLITGFPFKSEGYVKNGIRLLRCSNVKRGKIDWNYEITQYWSKITADLRKYILQEGDIVIAMDGSLVGKSFARLTNKDVPSLLLQRVARIRSKKIYEGYLKEFICSQYFTKYCDEVKTSSAIPHISPKDIREFKIPLPPLAEQKAIATALSDIDALLENIKHLITKKKAIKKGTMQQLLTGKKRLDGFTDNWEVKKLGDLGKTYSGLTGKTKIDFENGNFPYITFLNVLNNVKIDTTIFQFVNIKKGDIQNKAHKGDLFFNTSSETPEQVGMCAFLSEEINNLYLNSFCFGYRLNQNAKCNGLFLSYYINSNLGRRIFESLAQGATRYNLSKSNFNKVKIFIPTLKEQTAIAEILSDMDAEIEALENQLAKYENLKQAMMQELLTGKTRFSITN